jgi:hypothetical protein
MTCSIFIASRFIPNNRITGARKRGKTGGYILGLTEIEG